MSSVGGNGGQNIGRVARIAVSTARTTSDEPDPQTKAGEKRQKEEQRKARTAGIRADEAEAAHVDALNCRIEVLQEKLNDRESEARYLLPRVAELEQASRGITLACAYYTGMMVSGGGMISGAGYCTPPARDYLLAVGWLLLICGIAAHWIASAFGWPPKRKENP